MKIRIKFSKQGAMKYIGHLDVMRFFQKAMRRADVDIRYSGGFSPHQIMSFAAPLGLGLTGSGEYMDIEVLSSDPSAEMVRRLNAVMVEGMEVKSFRLLPDDAKNAMSLVAACDYTVRMRDDYLSGLSLTGRRFFEGLTDFIENGDLNVTKKTKKGEKQMDLRPLIFEHRLVEGGGAIFLKLSSGSTDNMKPEQLLAAFCESRNEEYPPFAFRINREEIYAKAERETLGEAWHTDAGDSASAQKDGAAIAPRFIPLEEFGEDIE